VDCIHPTPDEPEYDKVEMLYIDPEECIDCDACVEACPVDAITPEDRCHPTGSTTSSATPPTTERPAMTATRDSAPPAGSGGSELTWRP
jgi:ferredoxin